jgi:hypothetical protein
MTTKSIVDNGNGTYMVSSRLVHWAITSIITGIVVIGGYMVSWALNDRSWRAVTDGSIAVMQERLADKKAEVDSIATTGVKVHENTMILMDVRDRLLVLEERLRAHDAGQAQGSKR